MVTTKINNLERVRVNGVLYEWNDVFSCYYTVEGSSKTLQQKDLEGIDCAVLELGKWDSTDH